MELLDIQDSFACIIMFETKFCLVFFKKKIKGALSPHSHEMRTKIPLSAGFEHGMAGN
jgi:hypothetical protein